MKKKLTFFLLAAAITMTGCGKMNINGLLDGMWQLQEIYHENGEKETPTHLIYYSVQLELLKLTEIQNSSTPNRSFSNYIGEFQQTNDSLFLYNIRTWVYREDEIPVTREQMRPFGLFGDSERFRIVTLNHSQMVLQSRNARLTFRRF
ncbi:MAG: lipocalin-like domain-containing protein [Bacteroidaceae bacterium]